MAGQEQNTGRRPGVKHRTWIWQFDNPVPEIWLVMSDTARFNEAAELPKQIIEDVPQSDGSVRYMAHANLGLLRLAWEEMPVNWVSNRWFEHCRHFHKGPLKSLCAKLQIIPEETGCRVEYTIEAEAANLLGRAALAMGFFSAIGKRFGRLAENARAFGRGERETEFDFAPPPIKREIRERVEALIDRINATSHGHGLADKLAAYVLSRQEVDVWSIRPLKLARLWGIPDRHAIELCLEAVVQGLLRLRWDLLCPRCQTGKNSRGTLDELPEGTHCSSCNIDYGREYTKNVELAFHPAPGEWGILPMGTHEHAPYQGPTYGGGGRNANRANVICPRQIPAADPRTRAGKHHRMGIRRLSGSDHWRRRCSGRCPGARKSTGADQSQPPPPHVYHRRTRMDAGRIDGPPGHRAAGVPRSVYRTGAALYPATASKSTTSRSCSQT